MFPTNPKKADKNASIEGKLLEQYGGRGASSLPQTLMFDHVSPATRLLEKRRQMFEVQEALNSQKEEFARREDAFRRREEGLRRKDLELQESLIKFNKFLQENESKRNRALKRAAEEKKQREQKEKEIEKLEQQLRAKLKEEADLKEQVEKNLKYQDYLEGVVQSMSKFFPEISDILNRYNTLKDANQYLLEKHKYDENINDNTQKEFYTFKKFKENQLLNESNEIAEMQLILEQVKSKSLRIQSEVEALTLEASEKTLELGQVVASVSNILERCEESFRIRHNKPKVERSYDQMNPTGGGGGVTSATIANGSGSSSSSFLTDQCLKATMKLEDIAMFMVDYQEIVDEYRNSHDHFIPLSQSKHTRNTTNQNSTSGNMSTTNNNADHFEKSQVSGHEH
jgi:DNA repair exonuclease SbcCD ATPase subunit